MNQFKTAEDVDSFLKKLHAKVYEGMLEGEMDNHQDMRKMPLMIKTVATLVMAHTLKTSRPSMVSPALRYLVIV